MFLNGYPYTDFHEMNLDFLLRSMEELKKAFASFTSSNSLIFAEPLLHDLTKSYAKNTIVLDADGNAYISIQAVPSGVQLSDSSYWLMVFNFEEYTEKANKNFTVNYLRDTTRAPQAYAIGDWIVLNDVLYKATAAIAADELLVIGTNIVHFTVEQFLKDFITSVNNTLAAYSLTIQQYKNEIDASEALFTSTLQEQFNQAIGAATVDSEVVLGRNAFTGTTYDTIGEAIRGQDKLLLDLYNEAAPIVLSSYRIFDEFKRARYDVNGYTVNTTHISVKLPSGKYTFSGLTGCAFAVFEYISDSSGTQVTTYRTNPITFNYTDPVLVIRKSDSSAITDAEFIDIVKKFSIKVNTPTATLQSMVPPVYNSYIPEYDSTQPIYYQDYCIHNNKVYQAKSNYSAEAWTAGHWNLIGTLSDALKAKLNNIVIAPYYDDSITYSKGAHVINNNRIYRAKGDISAPEAWTSGHWEVMTTRLADYVDKEQHPTRALDNKYKNFAHRGDRVYTPYNTLPAFAKAKELGYSAIEVDLRFTSDNVPVILHDSIINTTARNMDGTVIPDPVYISDITYAEALDYDFGIWFSPEFAGTPIPTLSQTIALAVQLGLDVCIEIKQMALTNVQCQIVNNILTKYNYGQHVTFSCYILEYLQRMYNNSTWENVGYVFVNGGGDLSVINTANDVTGYDALDWLATIQRYNRTGMMIAANHIDSTNASAVVNNNSDLITYTIQSIGTLMSTSKLVTGCISEQIPDEDITDALINYYLT